MAELKDILKDSKKQQDIEIVNVDGICEQCFYPIISAYFDKKNNKLNMACFNAHESIIDWEIKDG